MANNLMKSIMVAPSIFTENTKFSQELIQSFATELTEGTDENGKPTVTYRSGFKRHYMDNTHDRFAGFAWTRTFETSPYPQYKYRISSKWGLADDEQQVYTSEDTDMDPNDLPLAGHYYIHGYGGYIEYPEELLLKFLDLGHVGRRLLYCGMHEDGIPHGLGTRFFYCGNQMAELPGLWQDGKLTHLKVNDKLVPVLSPENQADTEMVCRIFDRMAEICSEGDEDEKRFAMDLKKFSNKLMSLYMEDPKVIFSTYERCLKMGDENKEKALDLLEKAIERTPDMALKMEWTWLLYHHYAQSHHPKQAAVLEQYAGWCLANPDMDVDPTRRYIAYKTMAYRLRETNPAKAKEYETAAKALGDLLMAHFEMEADTEQGDFKAGFKYQGRFTGLVWQKTYKTHGGTSCSSYVGIADADGLLWCDLKNKTVTVDILDWVPEILPYNASAVYYGSGAGPTLLFNQNNAPSMLLVETDQENRCTFCGMHYDGIRHGLGSQFFHSGTGKRFSELQGLWKDGKLTHVRSGARLIPMDVEPNREDCEILCKIYQSIAESADSQNAKVYYGKAIELREKLRDENTGRYDLELLSECYKGAGRGEDYVALLNEIMDRFGNDAKLAWDLYTYLDEKHDPRITQALERYLASEGGDAEKRLKAASLLKRDDVAKEAYIKTFGSLHWRNDYTMSHGDFDCYVELDVWGFIAGGKVSGYAWSRNESQGPMEDSDWWRCCGVLKDEYEYDSQHECSVPKFACRISYRIGWNKIHLSGEVAPEVLVERDDNERITFFGMQKNGLRHGLGTEFYWAGDKLDRVFQGYWEEGMLTHKVDSENLVPIQKN